MSDVLHNREQKFEASALREEHPDADNVAIGDVGS
jgi:hypothetical protein